MVIYTGISTSLTPETLLGTSRYSDGNIITLSYSIPPCLFIGVLSR